LAAYHRPTHLILGLVVDTAAYIAEVVRFGIQDGRRAVHWAFTLVRSCAASPQALRVIIPPLTGQYLNLTKNSSLA
jgi:ABC-type amino acid transport system permease subunit